MCFLLIIKDWPGLSIWQFTNYSSVSFHTNCTPSHLLNSLLLTISLLFLNLPSTADHLYFTIIVLSVYQIHQSLTNISSVLTSINIPSISQFLLHVRLSYFMTVVFFFFFDLISWQSPPAKSFFLFPLSCPTWFCFRSWKDSHTTGSFSSRRMN